MKNDIINRIKNAAREIRPSSAWLVREREHLRIQANRSIQAQESLQFSRSKKPQIPALYILGGTLTAVCVVLYFVTTPTFDTVRMNVERHMTPFLKTQLFELRDILEKPIESFREINDLVHSEKEDMQVNGETKIETKRTSFEFEPSSRSTNSPAAVFLYDISSSSSASIQNGKRSMIETLRKIIHLPNTQNERAVVVSKNEEAGTLPAQQALKKDSKNKDVSEE
jgi:hypothetical protein